jgi:hypothetical protein
VEREIQHGFGRPPISLMTHGYRLVGVGSELHWSKAWKTFPDFLMQYFKHVMGAEWGRTQLDRREEKRHPIFKWYARTCEYQKETIRPGEVTVTPAIGAAVGILWITYGLYLLQHNVEIQKRLLTRIRSDDEVEVFGALYEVWVAAAMVWAGFDLKLEDENDRSQTHCEFTATSKRTGKSYSVEAKVCDPGNLSGSAGSDRSIRRQLGRALSKHAAHPRIVFIDLNAPGPPNGRDAAEWLKSRARAMRRQEITLKGAPPAYVFLTSFPYRYRLNSTDIPRMGILEGFKMPKMKFDAPFYSLRELGDFREEHKDLEWLQEALSKLNIPATLDGRLPSRAFVQESPRLLVGERYEVPTSDGKTALGELMSGIVNEEKKEAVCVLRLDNGVNAIYRMPLSENELAVYRESPETFFGVVQHVTKQISEPIELYDFLLSTYRGTPKEKLLEFMAHHPDIEEMKDLPQIELAKRYCERMAHAAFQSSKRGSRKN